MTSEKSAEWSKRVSDNFGKGYTQEQLRDLASEFSNISEQDAERLYSHLKVTTRSSFKVDMVAISEAKNQLGIFGGSASSENPQFQTVKWTCQACSKNFSFNELTADGDEFRGVFNFCPHCGFIPRIILFMEGNRVFYKGDEKTIDRMKIIRPGKEESEIDYYRHKTGEFFNRERERDSFLKILELKDLREERKQAEKIG